MDESFRIAPARREWAPAPGRSTPARRRFAARRRLARLQARRTLALLLLVTLACAGACARLAWLQVGRHRALAEAAVLSRAQTVPLNPSRGRILDREGRPLSAGGVSYRVAVYPVLVAGEDRMSLLAGALDLSPAQLRDRLAAGGGGPVFVATGLGAAAAGRVSALGLEGVAVVADEERYGPEALARHAVGYVSAAGEAGGGNAAGPGADGLELAWDAYLGGRGPELLALFVDGRGQPLGELGWRKLHWAGGNSPWTGLPCDLVTTIDAGIQTAVEAALDRTGPDGRPAVPRGAAVVLDPATGDILALASRPNYEQGDVAGSLGRADGALLDRAIAAYPPGSAFKPLLLAAALEEGVTEPGATFHCDGSAPDGPGQGISCTARARGGHGDLTLEEALAVSCNVVFTELGLELGQDRLAEWAGRFGLGTTTGAGLPGENAGSLPPPATVRAEPQAAFGQGSLTASPLQMALAYAAIANGGCLPRPRLALELRSPVGARTILSRQRSSRVVSPAVAAEVTLALTRAVQTGTGRAAAVAEGVAGKTGTAETGRRGADGRELYDGWFAGFWPVWDPRYVVVVLIEDTPAGGGAAAGVFGDILRGILETD